MSTPTSALIIGSTGQDGKLLTAQLAGKGYQVTGIKRGDEDLGSAEAVTRLLSRTAPSEFYYLAAYHHSSEQQYPSDLELFRSSYEVNVLYPLHFLDAIRAHWPKCRFFYASSSLIFGDSPVEAQKEDSPYHPHSAYGITKLDGLLACRFYRENHGVFASAGILFNHESEYRQPSFLSKKIVAAVCDIAAGSVEKLVIGNTLAEVDWGYAPDYVDAMQRILLAEKPGEFIIASGVKRQVSEFLDIAFSEKGLNWRDHVIENQQQLKRERRTIVGDHSRLTQATGWFPKTSFRDMVQLLVKAEWTARGKT